MIFVTGAYASGKRTLAKSLGCLGEEAAYEVQLFVESSESDVDEVASELLKKKVVTCSEMGQGIVPADARDRAWRERAGRLACLLAAEAECVVRMVCGIPVVIKGRIPANVLPKPSTLPERCPSGAFEEADGARSSNAMFNSRNAGGFL